MSTLFKDLEDSLKITEMSEALFLRLYAQYFAPVGSTIKLNREKQEVIYNTVTEQIVYLPKDFYDFMKANAFDELMLKFIPLSGCEIECIFFKDTITSTVWSHHHTSSFKNGTGRSVAMALARAFVAVNGDVNFSYMT